MNNCNRFLALFLALAAVLFSGAGCTKKARLARVMRQADDDFNAERYDTAEKNYEEVLHSVSDPHAIAHLGLALYHQGRIGPAFSVLKKAGQLTPNKPDIETAMSAILIAAHDPHNGAQQAKLALTHQPTNAQAMLLLADAASSPQDISQFAAFLRSLPGQPSHLASFHVALASLALQSHDLPSAEAEARQSLAIDSKYPEAHYFLSQICYQKGDIAQGSAELKTAVALSPWDSPIRMKAAEVQFATGEREAAVSAINEVTSKASYYIPAWATLMRFQFALKDYKDCQQTIAAVLQRDPDNEEANLQTGLVYMAQDNLSAAQTTLQNLQTRHPSFIPPQYYLAVLALRQNETAKARQYLTGALRVNTNYVQADLLLAQIDIRTENPGAAIERLERVLRRDSKNLDAAILLAQAYTLRQQPARAQALYRQLIQAQPKDPRFAYLLGLSLAQTGDPAAASQSFVKSLEISPDYYPALNAWVNVAIVEKQFDSAEKFIRQRIEKSPKDANLQLLLARIFQAGGKNSQAEECLNQAIASDPSLVPAYVSLAGLYLAEKKENEALDKLNAVVARTNDVTAFMSLGVLQLQLKHYDAARDAFKKLADFAPGFSPALNNLAVVDSEYLNEPDQALPYAEKAHNLHPGDPSSADTLGWIVYKRGDYARALGLLQEGADGQPNDPEVNYHLGMARYMLDQEGLARQALQAAVSSPVAFFAKDDARERLAILNVNPQSPTDQNVALLEQALKRDSQDPVVLSRLAEIEDRRAHYDKAADYYQQALKSHHNNPNLMASLAIIEADHLNQPDDALALARAAHKLDDANPLASAALGRLSYQRGDYSFAITLLQQAADANPSSFNLSSLARVRYAVGKIAEAATAMQQALAKDANGPEHEACQTFLTLAQASISPTAAQAALPQAKAALQKDPHDLPALYVSGLAAQAAGDNSTAAKSYDAALTISPKFSPALRQSAILASADPDHDDRAFEFAQKAAPFYPGDPELSKILGRGSYRRGDYARSSQVLEEASRRLKDPEIFYYLGMDYYKLKRAGESKRALQQALALNPPATLAADARRVLAELK